MFHFNINIQLFESFASGKLVKNFNYPFASNKVISLKWKIHARTHTHIQLNEWTQAENQQPQTHKLHLSVQFGIQYTQLALIYTRSTDMYFFVSFSNLPFNTITLSRPMMCHSVSLSLSFIRTQCFYMPVLLSTCTFFCSSEWSTWNCHYINMNNQ